MLQFVRCFLEGKQADWDKFLPSLGMSLRSMVSASTGYTPNYLTFGQEINLPAEILMGLVDVNQHAVTPSEHAMELSRILQEAFSKTRERLKGVQMRQKRQYDTKCVQRAFSKGDLVYCLDSSSKVGQSKKLQPIFKGPYLILKQKSPSLFIIADRKKTRLVHHDRLQPCKDRHLPLWIQRKRHHHLTPEIEFEELSGDEGRDTKLVEESLLEGDNLPPTPTRVEETMPVIKEPASELVPDPLGESGDSCQSDDPGGLDEPRLVTRRGRCTKRPEYLKEYVC